MLMESISCHIAFLLIPVNSFFPASAIIRVVALFIFFATSAIWWDRLPLLFIISPQVLVRPFPVLLHWVLAIWVLAISSMRVAYSISDSTPPCLRLSLMLISLLSPYLVCILASKLRVTGLCVGNSPGTGEFPAQMASYAENVSIWWRHHVYGPAVLPVRCIYLAHVAR